MGNWDMDIAEWIGKAIPNEFSKMAGYTKYIPYVGQAMAGAGALDAGATSTSDTFERMKEAGASESEARKHAYSTGIPYAMDTYNSGNDPGYYGSGGDINDDWWNRIGSTASFFGKGNMFGQGGQGMGGFSGMMGTYGKGEEVYNIWSDNDLDYDPALAGTAYDTRIARDNPYTPMTGYPQTSDYSNFNYGNNNPSHSTFWSA